MTTATDDRVTGQVEPYTDVELDLPDRRDGKVRVSYALPNGQRLFVTTDRLSAFDRIINGVAYKGQVLNQLAAWWFDQTRDIVDNHAISTPDPNVLIGISARPLPVEVIVRGYITGITSTSLWRRYDEGARTIYGYHFPDGLQKNTALPQAIITPTTKAEAGAHDEALTCLEVTERGLVERGLWARVQEAALAVFARGQEVAARAGLILADTKYEFGLAPDGRLLLIDEMHTPDSSRFWEASSYEGRLAAAEEPESLDKEVIRRALADSGYSGDGAPPLLADEVWTETTRRYVTAYERLTGQTIDPGSYPVGPRIVANLTAAGVL